MGGHPAKEWKRSSSPPLLRLPGRRNPLALRLQPHHHPQRQSKRMRMRTTLWMRTRQTRCSQRTTLSKLQLQPRTRRKPLRRPTTWTRTNQLNPNPHHPQPSLKPPFPPNKPNQRTLPLPQRPALLGPQLALLPPSLNQLSTHPYRRQHQSLKVPERDSSSTRWSSRTSNRTQEGRRSGPSTR